MLNPDCYLWKSVWFEYFDLLKVCIKHSGEIPETESDRFDRLAAIVKSTVSEAHLVNIDNESDICISDSLDLFFFEDECSESSDSFSSEIATGKILPTD